MYNSEGLDIAEILKRAAKYLIEGFAVAFAAYFIPRGRRLGLEEVAMIGITAAATFAILDTFASSTLSSATQLGAGFGIGTGLTGLPLAGVMGA
jgi:hypothetical protein